MTQPPPTDPDWVTMRAQHQQECAAFGRQVEAEMQAMRRRHETENQNLTRRIEEIKAELLGRHKQQEGGVLAQTISEAVKDLELCTTSTSKSSTHTCPEYSNDYLSTKHCLSIHTRSKAIAHPRPCGKAIISQGSR